MKPVILFRPDFATEGEYEVAKKYFRVVPSRTLIQRGETVLGRYSVLPYYRELTADVRYSGAEMLLSPYKHQAVSDISCWYPDLEGLTPRTFFGPLNTLEALRDQGRWPSTPMVLKGHINSRKGSWKTHMYAKDISEARGVLFALTDDALITTQGVCVREYVPLRSFGEGISGCPISNEWRYFVCRDQVVARGFYWSDAIEDDLIPDSVLASPPDVFVRHQVIPRLKAAGGRPLYVVDVAETQDGRWIVIEMNDAQMCGLSAVPPDELYRNLAQILKKGRSDVYAN